MADRFVEYKSNSGKTRVYRVLGSYTDEIMYGLRRGSKVRCLRLEKPWAPGESFVVVASRCVDVAPPEPEPIDEEDAYERGRYVDCHERGIPF